MPNPSRPNGLRTVLVAEDDAIIGFDITDALEDAGYAILGPASSCSDAFAWLERSVPDIVVLDAILRDGPCTEFARELQNRAIPFIVYSGRTHAEMAAELTNVRWLEKPCAHADLLTALDQMLASSSGSAPMPPTASAGGIR
jgi:DNA-binding response OmpR family regulator